MGEWISVEDKDNMPKVYQKVLIYPTEYEESEWTDYSRSGTNLFWAVFFHDKKYYAYDYKEDCICEMKKQPTHYMPMPPPPKSLH